MKKKSNVLATVAVAMCVLAACKSEQKSDNTALRPDAEAFSAVIDGDTIGLYTLKNGAGTEVSITNYGGRVVAITLPDRNGEMRDVVLGFDSIQAYFPQNNKTDFGATIGRYANRINQGRFTLDGKEYQLPRNNYGHCLHGGTDMGTLGWQYRVFKVDEANDSTLVLSITDNDGNNGFPGTVKATVTYSLTADNALDISYKATTDAPTIINLTNHTYFNLSGDPTKPVTDNELTVNADAFTPVDSTFMTTGEILPVDSTPMDFRKAKVIGAEIERIDYEQIKNGHGFDHNWVLNSRGDITVPAAAVYCPATGIRLQVFTDEPGIQIYTGNFLDGTVTGKHQITYNKRTAICLETQKYPDTPNKPQWPTAVVRPGETYTSHCIYRFSVEK